MNDQTVNWIAQGGLWLRFATETQLFGRKADPSLALEDPNIRTVVARLRSDSAGLPALREGKLRYTGGGNAFWDLFFLADLGLTAEDAGIRAEADALLQVQRGDGTFVMQKDTKPGVFLHSGHRAFFPCEDGIRGRSAFAAIYRKGI